MLRAINGRLNWVSSQSRPDLAAQTNFSRQAFPKNCLGVIRWLPTDRMIADGLTKDKIDPIELLRSCVRVGKYQISAEETVLANQAAEKELRAKRRPVPVTDSSPIMTFQGCRPDCNLIFEGAVQRFVIELESFHMWGGMRLLNMSQATVDRLLLAIDAEER